MLLRHTTSEVKERKALTVNPAKTCQPIGAMYAALGLHSCIPHSHGSQGCCSYHRSTLTRHYKEPVIATTSSFTEGASVFGGQANLVQAIDNIFTIYNPDMIAVHSTCLSETIGDDLPQIISKAKESGKIPEGKRVIYCNTPSYIGSHVTGFSNMLKGIVREFAVFSETKKDIINVLPGWCEPSDMREIKRICSEMGQKIIMFPDTSDTLDTPQTGAYTMYPKGGSKQEDLMQMGSAKHTLSLGNFTSSEAAKDIDAKCKVKFTDLDIPIGLKATDRFIDALHTAGELIVPESIEDERGRLLDMITDMEQYFAGKRVALFGDPDDIVPMAEFLVDLNMKPVYIVTGTPGKYTEERLKEILKDIPEAKIRQGAQADMFLMHQWIKEESVDLLIGNTYGKYIARDEDIPLIRFGFPIVDRVGHSYFPKVGYMGAMRLVEKFLDAILNKKDKDAPEESFELVL